jgi:hypothetical protein
MNTNERAFQRVAKISKEKAQKQELSAEKVELATIYDDLSGSIKEANGGFIQATDLISKANRLVKKSILDNEALIKELDKAETLIKQIGLDKELTKVQKAKSQVNENLNALEKYYSGLLSL